MLSWACQVSLSLKNTAASTRVVNSGMRRCRRRCEEVRRSGSHTEAFAPTCGTLTCSRGKAALYGTSLIAGCRRQWSRSCCW